MPGTFSPAFVFYRGMNERAEPVPRRVGGDNLRDAYYILALVLHEQSDDLAESIARYQGSLREKGLSDIPFHATPLLSGHDAYEGMDIAERKRLFSAFRVFFRHLPVRYGLVVLRAHDRPRARRGGLATLETTWESARPAGRAAACRNPTRG